MNHEYDQAELPAIEKLESLGYDYLSGAELSPVPPCRNGVRSGTWCWKAGCGRRC